MNKAICGICAREEAEFVEEVGMVVGIFDLVVCICDASSANERSAEAQKKLWSVHV